MQSGEYFISEEERKARRLSEKNASMEHKVEVKKRKKEAEFEPPAKETFKKRKQTDSVKVRSAQVMLLTSAFRASLAFILASSVLCSEDIGFVLSFEDVFCAGCER